MEEAEGEGEGPDRGEDTLVIAIKIISKKRKCYWEPRKYSIEARVK